MNVTLKLIATVILLAAFAMFIAPIALCIVFNPAPINIIELGDLIAKGAMPTLVIGSCLYTKSIGYSFLWGLLSLTGIGFLALMFFPNRAFSNAKQDAISNS